MAKRLTKPQITYKPVEQIYEKNLDEVFDFLFSTLRIDGNITIDVREDNTYNNLQELINEEDPVPNR